MKKTKEKTSQTPLISIGTKVVFEVSNDRQEVKNPPRWNGTVTKINNGSVEISDSEGVTVNMSFRAIEKRLGV